MSDYKYNEITYAKLIYDKGFQTKYMPTELRLLVLYFRDILNYKHKKREEEIYKFCAKNISNFKKEKYFKSINKALRAGQNKNQKLIEINSLDIYQSEFDYINSLDIKYDYKKVLFAFLVNYKLTKIIYEYKNEKEYNSIYFKGGKRKYNNIKKISNIPITISINDEVINELDKLGYIKILHKGIIILEFLNNCNSNSEIAFTITDFNNVGLYMDFYNEVKGICKCAECGEVIKMTNNKTKYCSECAREMQLHWQRESMRKLRNNM